MLRYRKRNCSTDTARKSFHNVDKLGKIEKIVAKRFMSDRGYITDRECIMVYGENGTMRFEGLSWGYFGEGSRGTYELLQKCSVKDDLAKHAAFVAKRLDTVGTDWVISFVGAEQFLIEPRVIAESSSGAESMLD